MNAELFNKIVLYTTPFHEMEEIPMPTMNIIDFRAELSAEDRDNMHFRNNERELVKAGNAKLKYTSAEARAWKAEVKTCAICNSEFKGSKDKHGDHNHETGEWRGVLCGNCNAGLGMFKDSPELCEAAAAYLRKV